MGFPHTPFLTVIANFTTLLTVSGGLRRLSACFPLSINGEDVPGYRAAEKLLHPVKVLGLAQDPHELAHGGLRGHVIGLQQVQGTLQVSAHMIHRQAEGIKAQIRS